MFQSEEVAGHERERGHQNHQNAVESHNTKEDRLDDLNVDSRELRHHCELQQKSTHNKGETSHWGYHLSVGLSQSPRILTIHSITHYCLDLLAELLDGGSETEEVGESHTAEDNDGWVDTQLDHSRNDKRGLALEVPSFALLDKEYGLKWRRLTMSIKLTRL